VAGLGCTPAVIVNVSIQRVVVDAVPELLTAGNISLKTSVGDDMVARRVADTAEPLQLYRQGKSCV
jgi:hypothetical protein